LGSGIGHRSPPICLSMIFSKNRWSLFGIMLRAAFRNTISI
jgi:hypothetical protein